MTNARRLAKLPTPGQLTFSLMCGFSLLLILRNSDTAIEYMGSGLRLCVKTVIPSLFPFMVISELIVSSGLGELMGKVLDRPVRWLFGVSGESAPAVILGALCGFPLGARSAAALLDREAISRREASRLLTFCNNPSSAFIINAVGITLYSSRSLGVTLYVVTLINAIIIGIAQRLFLRPLPRSASHHTPAKSPSGIEAFTASVTHSALGMLNVCAYVVFFSAIVGCLSSMLSTLGISPFASALIYGIVELSGGVAATSALGTDIVGVCLCAFIVGWSGLSVHFQIISSCAGRGISYRGYFIAKIVQGLMNSLVMFTLCRLFPSLLLPDGSKETWAILPSAFTLPYSSAVLILFAASLSLAIPSIIPRKQK